MVVPVTAAIPAVVHRHGPERAVLRVSIPHPSCMVCIVRWRLAVCTSACQNGGTCSAPNTCSCTSSWTGATCTTREIRLFLGILILTFKMTVGSCVSIGLLQRWVVFESWFVHLLGLVARGHLHNPYVLASAEIPRYSFSHHSFRIVFSSLSKWGHMCRE